MDNYLDFGLDSDDSDSDNDMQCTALDSDEEEARDNDRLFKILMEPKTQSKKSRDVDDFEMEMEAELDKRAMEIESRGGLEHQKSLSRSSSTSSLNKKSPCPSPKLSRRSSLINTGGPSTSSSPLHQKKSVRFASADSPTCDTNNTINSSQDPLIPKPPKQTKIQTTTLKEGETTTTATNETEETKKTKSFYNDIYFDSDESDGEDETSSTKKKNKKLILSNDDLFYDPESDARDQEWMDKKRRKYCQDKSPTSQKSNLINGADSSSSVPPTFPTAKPLPNSDAVLNCPACFTVLCVDCQQHALYPGQYRAMFVMNCSIVNDETIRVPIKDAKKFKRTNRGEKRLQNTKTMEDDPSNPAHLPENDSFNPVKCKVCRTQIAVYDTDEVYHFFNVLSSAP